MKVKGIRIIQGNYKLSKTKGQYKLNEIIEKKETKNHETEVGKFQLVVIEQIPWYKKAVKTIGSFLKKLLTIKIEITY